MLTRIFARAGKVRKYSTDSFNEAIKRIQYTLEEHTNRLSKHDDEISRLSHTLAGLDQGAMKWLHLVPAGAAIVTVNVFTVNFIVDKRLTEFEQNFGADIKARLMGFEKNVGADIKAHVNAGLKSDTQTA
ncbi:hypothetical protein HK097_007200 [Rhizophlyctis rosea]|uniref:Uncharacterized protein n=1 Tax=Rhizophlyctis rosea TaxID=64517 RepID=A0AAD5SJN5_9FUNG|nr:hypothetical protein HK097_007200 [Rhizophlyctis rosea]